MPSLFTPRSKSQDTRTQIYALTDNHHVHHFLYKSLNPSDHNLKIRMLQQVPGQVQQVPGQEILRVCYLAPYFGGEEKAEAQITTKNPSSIAFTHEQPQAVTFLNKGKLTLNTFRVNVGIHGGLLQKHNTYFKYFMEIYIYIKYI